MGKFAVSLFAVLVGCSSGDPCNKYKYAWDMDPYLVTPFDEVSTQVKNGCNLTVTVHHVPQTSLDVRGDDPVTGGNRRLYGLGC